MTTPLKEENADLNDEMQQKAESIDANEFIDVDEIRRLRRKAAEFDAECKQLRELKHDGLSDDRVLAEADSKSPTPVYLSEY